MTRILVTGGTGQVGLELTRRAWPKGVEIVAPSRAELDLTDGRSLAGYVAEGGFAAVINPAAYAAVDRAESEAAEAFAVNATAAGLLATGAKQAGIPLVHVSTDYVFHGDASAPYETDDAIDPIGVYGASKAAGEDAIRIAGPRWAIVRTAWVVGPNRSNFVKTMLSLADGREAVRIVADQRGAPTLAADLADALATVTLRMISDRSAPTGLFHFANAGETNWADFAEAIFLQAEKRGARVPKVERIATADYPTAARRPAYSLLSTSRIERDYGIVPRAWRDWLPGLVAEIMEQGR